MEDVNRGSTEWDGFRLTACAIHRLCVSVCGGVAQSVTMCVMSVRSTRGNQAEAAGRRYAAGRRNAPEPRYTTEWARPDRDRGSCFPLFLLSPFLHPSLHLYSSIPRSPVTPGLGPCPGPASANTEECRMANREMTKRGQREMWREGSEKKGKEKIPKGKRK